MRSPNDLWEAIGSLPEEEFIHVLTKLFTMYEEQLTRKPGDESALQFFRNLDTAISQTDLCNLNRR